MVKDYELLKSVYGNMTPEQVCKSVIAGFAVDGTQGFDGFNQRDQSGRFRLEDVEFNLTPKELAIMTL